MKLGSFGEVFPLAANTAAKSYGHIGSQLSGEGSDGPVSKNRSPGRHGLLGRVGSHPCARAH